ncbi:MAG: hypothetical protein M3N38_07370, partial [Pseudomonadota bacterium]|nr:hypothetical protein [Pseudomonadota bacterium]
GPISFKTKFEQGHEIYRQRRSLSTTATGPRLRAAALCIFALPPLSPLTRASPQATCRVGRIGGKSGKRKNWLT